MKGTAVSTELAFQFFDCDNHYYEAVDAFTRYLEPAYRKRAMQWAQIDGKTRLLVGGKLVGGPVPTAAGTRAPADPVLDPFWQPATCRSCSTGGGGRPTAGGARTQPQPPCCCASATASPRATESRS